MEFQKPVFQLIVVYKRTLIVCIADKQRRTRKHKQARVLALDLPRVQVWHVCSSSAYE